MRSRLQMHAMPHMLPEYLGRGRRDCVVTTSWRATHRERKYVYV